MSSIELGPSLQDVRRLLDGRERGRLHLLRGLPRHGIRFVTSVLHFCGRCTGPHCRVRISQRLKCPHSTDSPTVTRTAQLFRQHIFLLHSLYCDPPSISNIKYRLCNLDNCPMLVLCDCLGRTVHGSFCSSPKSELAHICIYLSDQSYLNALFVLLKSIEN